MYDDDYGCEERPAGSPKMIIVYLERDGVYEKTIKVEESYIVAHNIVEGSEWAEGIE